MEREGHEAPEEGDYVVFDTGPLGQYTGVAVKGHLGMGTFCTEGEAYRYIADRMGREKYWPGVWFQDDHGGLRPVNMAEACSV